MIMTSLVTTARIRTKDKYRAVYSDYQRLEMEKDFHYQQIHRNKEENRAGNEDWTFRKTGTNEKI